MKEKKPDGTSSLVIGKVYFDKNYNKVVYVIDFPDKQTVIMHDTSFYRIEGKKIVEHKKVPNTNDFTIFNLCLNGKLINYGLENSIFKPTKVEKENNMVITTWVPDSKMAKKMGNVMLSVKDKKLFGVIIFSPKNEIIEKKFFNKYINANGLLFPSEIVEIRYYEGKEYYKVTTYKNVVVDENGKEDIYNYKIF
jgi:hypothetical protein